MATEDVDPMFLLSRDADEREDDGEIRESKDINVSSKERHVYSVNNPATFKRIYSGYRKDPFEPKTPNFIHVVKKGIGRGVNKKALFQKSITIQPTVVEVPVNKLPIIEIESDISLMNKMDVEVEEPKKRKPSAKKSVPKASPKKRGRPPKKVEVEDEVVKKSNKVITVNPRKSKTLVGKSPPDISTRKTNRISPVEKLDTKVKKIKENIVRNLKKSDKKPVQKDTNVAAEHRKTLESIDISRLTNTKSSKNNQYYNLADLKNFAKDLNLPTVRKKMDYLILIANRLVTEGLAKKSQFDFL
jgi:hypothetical protein